MSKSPTAVCGSGCLSMVVDDDERKAVETDVERSGKFVQVVRWLEEEGEGERVERWF